MEVSAPLVQESVVVGPLALHDVPLPNPKLERCEGVSDDQTSELSTPDKNDTVIMKPTFKSALQAKKRLQAFSMHRPGSLPTSPLAKKPKVDAKPEEDKKTPKKVKEKDPNEKAKAVIEEIEAIKRNEYVHIGAYRPTMRRSRSRSYDRERFKKVERKSRNYRRRSPTPEKTKKVDKKTKKHPKSWKEFEDYDQIRDAGVAPPKETNDLSKQLLFVAPPSLIAPLQILTVNRDEKTVPFEYVRYTRTKPAVSFSVNFTAIKQAFLSRKAILDVIPKEWASHIENLFSNSIKYKTDLSPKPKSRSWFPKSWRENVNECKLLENSIGLSFLQTYTGEDEEGEIAEDENDAEEKVEEAPKPTIVESKEAESEITEDENSKKKRKKSSKNKDLTDKKEGKREKKKRKKRENKKKKKKENLEDKKKKRKHKKDKSEKLDKVRDKTEKKKLQSEKPKNEMTAEEEFVLQKDPETLESKSKRDKSPPAVERSETSRKRKFDEHEIDSKRHKTETGDHSEEPPKKKKDDEKRSDNKKEETRKNEREHGRSTKHDSGDLKEKHSTKKDIKMKDAEVKSSRSKDAEIKEINQNSESKVTKTQPEIKDDRGRGELKDESERKKGNKHNQEVKRDHDETKKDHHNSAKDHDSAKKEHHDVKKDHVTKKDVHGENKDRHGGKKDHHEPKRDHREDETRNFEVKKHHQEPKEEHKPKKDVHETGRGRHETKKDHREGEGNIFEVKKHHQEVKEDVEAKKDFLEANRVHQESRRDSEEARKGHVELKGENSEVDKDHPEVVVKDHHGRKNDNCEEKKDPNVVKREAKPKRKSRWEQTKEEMEMKNVELKLEGDVKESTPDTDEYHSHWESDDDVSSSVPRRSAKLNRSWESDEELFERTHNRNQMHPHDYEKLEIPLNLNIKTDRRRSFKAKWEKPSYMDVETEMKRLEEERKSLSEERKKLELEKEKMMKMKQEVVRSRKAEQAEDDAACTSTPDVDSNKITSEKNDIHDFNIDSLNNSLLSNISSVDSIAFPIAVLENEYEEFIKAVSSDTPSQVKKRVSKLSRSSSTSSSSSSERDHKRKKRKGKKKKRKLKAGTVKNSIFNEFDIPVPSDLPDVPLVPPLPVPVPVPSPIVEPVQPQAPPLLFNSLLDLGTKPEPVKDPGLVIPKPFVFSSITLPTKKVLLDNSKLKLNDDSDSADFTDKFTRKLDDETKTIEKLPKKPEPEPEITTEVVDVGKIVEEPLPEVVQPEPEPEPVQPKLDEIKPEVVKPESVKPEDVKPEEISLPPPPVEKSPSPPEVEVPVKPKAVVEPKAPPEKKRRRSRSRERKRSPVKKRDSASSGGRRRYSPVRRRSPRRRPLSPRRRSPSPRRRSPSRRSSLSPRRRSISPRKHSSPLSRRRFRSPRRSPSLRRSLSPRHRGGSRKRTPSPRSRRGVSPINSPLDGFKRSVADSTISDDMLPQPTPDDYVESPPYSKFYDNRKGDRLRRSLSPLPTSPKRIPLDDRINLVLGLEKNEPPKPQMNNCYQGYDSYPYEQPQYGQYPPQYNHYGSEKADYMPYPRYSVPPPLPSVVKPVPAPTKVVQIGNILQVVPNEEIQHMVEAVKPVETCQKIVQVGNMLQIVPATMPTKLDTIQPQPVPLPEIPSAEAVMKQKNAERKAEREKRRLEREKRRRDKEKKRKEREKRKQMKLKLKTENMIKRALQLEADALGCEEVEGEGEEEGDPVIQWPPVQVIVSATTGNPTKGILVTEGFSKLERKLLKGEKKSVQFADGIRPGEGTSPSGGEELSSPPPVPARLPKEKRLKKVKLPRKSKKKKIKVKVVKKRQEDTEDEDEDNMPPPSPPPGSPPPHVFPSRVKTHTINNVHQFVSNLVPPGFVPPYRSPQMPPIVMNRGPPHGPGFLPPPFHADVHSFPGPLPNHGVPSHH